jgi:hypothetical protein
MNTRENLVNRLVARTMKKAAKSACSSGCMGQRRPGRVVCGILCQSAAQKLRR